MSSMNDIFSSAVIRIRELTEAQGQMFLTDLPPGATDAEIDAAETFIGSPLPTSLRHFLTIHNGAYLSCWKPSSSDPTQRGFVIYSIEICGTADIIKFTKNARLHLEGIDLEAVGDSLGISDLRAKAESYISIAAINRTSHQVCFSRRDALADGEYPLIEAIFDEEMRWIDRLDTDIKVRQISDSFETFLQKSLTHMIETKTGFKFWRKSPALP